MRYFRAIERSIPTRSGILISEFAIALIGFNLATIGLLVRGLLACTHAHPLTAIVHGVALAAANGMFKLIRLAPPQGFLTNLSLF